MGDSSSRRRWWTQEEDQILQEEVKSQELGGQQGAKNWSAISESLPGRSNKDCRKRWTKISLSSRKGTWSGSEDHLLRKAVTKFGFQWTKVAEMVGSRHPDQCAKRWHHSLDPNVKRGPWTPDEDAALVEAVQRIGRDWKAIGRELFPSRSTTDIKNRYVILSRRQAFSISSQDNCCRVEDAPPSDTTKLILSQPNNPSSNGVLDIATTPCIPEGLSLAVDELSIPLPQDIPSYLLNDAPSFFLSDITDRPFTPDWAAFDGQQTPFNRFFPDTANNSDIESCDPNLLINSSTPETPSMLETALTGAPSTLVLEDLEPETVNLVIDTLLKTNSKFEMRLYNTGS
ncbi:hypothetical protein BJX99DRAFT_264331 [Aspergillus californicus]